MTSVHDPVISVDRRAQGNKHGTHQIIGAIVHCTVSPDRKGSGDVQAVLEYLERTPEQLGIHRCIDKEGIVGAGANYEDRVWHCGGANTGYVGFELVGMTWYNWPARRVQLEKLARHLAYLHVKYGVPLVYGEFGVRQHRDVKSPLSLGHDDVSRLFPMKRVLKRARYLAVNGW